MAHSSTLLTISVAAALLSACGDDDKATSLQALPSTFCGPLEYGGDGSPDLLIVSDLPVVGYSATAIAQINKAIRMELKDRKWKAGAHRVGFQACDDAVASEMGFTQEKCAANARAYAANPAVVGVLGTFNSGCAAVEIPIASAAPGGGLAMISPSNTSPCLTVAAPGCDAGEPASYYPGVRSYVRVVPHDVYQGAALAEYAKSIGVAKVFILHDDDSYGSGVAATFKNAATFVGVTVAGDIEFSVDGPTDFTAMMNMVKASGADAIFVGGFTSDATIDLIKEKVAVLGANSGAVKMLLPDGFSDASLAEATNGAVAGAVASAPGVGVASLSGPAKDFATRFKTEVLGAEEMEVFTLPGYGAARALLGAVASSNGTRADVIAKLFATHVENDVLGSYSFDANGDPKNASGAVTSFTFFRITDVLEPIATLAPKQATVEAAYGR